MIPKDNRTQVRTVRLRLTEYPPTNRNAFCIQIMSKLDSTVECNGFVTEIYSLNSKCLQIT